MKIDVGMYVRTERGKIWLVTSTKAIDGHKRRIVNASHNIIDLIEVGDYVNGVKIDELSHNRFTNAKAVATNNSLRKDTGKQYWFENDDIKSIVTKEQFEQIQYKVGE